jgi:hypothetical protein
MAEGDCEIISAASLKAWLAFCSPSAAITWRKFQNIVLWSKIILGDLILVDLILVDLILVDLILVDLILVDLILGDLIGD